MRAFIAVLTLTLLLRSVVAADTPTPILAKTMSRPMTAKPRADAFVAGQSLDGVVVLQRKQPPFTLDAAATIPDAIHIYFLARQRPITIRIRLNLDDQPLRELWPKLVRQLFEAFDRDRDGFLNRYELERTFPTKNISAMFSGHHFMRGPDSVIVFEQLDRDHDNRISFDELATYYSHAAQDIVTTINSVANTASDVKIEQETTERLVQLLDANRDGKITRDELRHAERLFERHDENDDETLSLSELQLPSTKPLRPQATAITSPRPVPETATVKPINSTTTSTTTATTTTSDLIVVMGDTVPDSLRTRWAANYPDRPFTRVPDFIGEANIASNDKRSLRITPARGAAVPDGCEVRTTPPSRIVIRVAQQFVDVSVATMNPRAKTNATDELRDAFPNDAKKPLCEDELTTPYLRVVFDDVDFDNDGRVAKNEFERFLALQQRVIDTSMAVVSRVQTPNLFQLLDADGDERLCLRELRTAIDRLRVLEDGSPEFVTRAALRPSAQVSFTKSFTPNAKVFASGGFAASPTATTQQSRPLWFQKMDRNNDGDISRREFLGSPERFAELDRDHDGLLSLDEVTVAKK